MKTLLLAALLLFTPAGLAQESKLRYSVDLPNFKLLFFDSRCVNKRVLSLVDSKTLRSGVGFVNNQKQEFCWEIKGGEMTGRWDDGDRMDFPLSYPQLRKHEAL